MFDCSRDGELRGLCLIAVGMVCKCVTWTVFDCSRDVELRGLCLIAVGMVSYVDCV